MSDPYQEGINAVFMHLNQNDNPYEKGFPQHKEWLKGLMFALGEKDHKQTKSITPHDLFMAHAMQGLIVQGIIGHVDIPSTAAYMADIMMKARK